MADPLGVLEEGEIYFKSSEQNLVDASTGALFNVVRGPVVASAFTSSVDPNLIFRL